jgi:hypothetical protein
MTTGSAPPPFLDVSSFDREEPEAPPPGPPAAVPWSPFLSVYESADGEAEYDPLHDAYAGLVHELYDEEFDQSLFELLAEGRNLHRDYLSSGRPVAEADRIVALHFARLASESESMLDAMAREFGSREAEIVEGEAESFAERYAAARSVEPAFEGFLNGVVKKFAKGVSKVAGAALQGLKNVTVIGLFNRLRPIIRPLLNRVMQMAIGRLPVAVQPAARVLAQRLGLAAPAPAQIAPRPVAATTPPQADPTAAIADASAIAAIEPATPADAGGVSSPGGQDAAPSGEEEAGDPVQESAGPDVSEVQREFDARVAETLLGEDEVALELEAARERSASASGVPVFSDLEAAREQFVQDLQNLKEGESAAPYVENFLPAVLPALRLATKIIGRPRIVNFLAGLLGKLITNLVGPAQTPALSRAIVDAGLRLVSLEAPEEDRNRLAASAVAETVEETARRVASLPEHVLDEPELLEGFALEAFEQAAAANLPAVFPEATYRRRPDLLEGGVNAAWVMLPLRRPAYKRCSSTFRVTLTPQAAEAIDTFEDTPLSEYLQEQLGFEEGEDVEAEVHLYEVLPGGTLADITANEGETAGLGAADEATVSQLHPLTEEAASVLLGKPGVGRRLPAWSSRVNPGVGQRFYHLAVGRRPLVVPGVHRRVRVRRLARVHVTLDAIADQMRVCVFLSEAKAQRLAVRLRQQAHVGTLTVGFTRLLARRLPPILHGKRPRRLRLVHPRVPAAAPRDAILGQLAAIVPPAFVRKLQEWLVHAFAGFAKTQAAKFLAASEDPADGVTLRFTIEHPPGLKEIASAIGGSPAVATRGAVTAGNSPTVLVDVFPGHRCA